MSHEPTPNIPLHAFRYAVVEDEALARRVLVKVLSQLSPQAEMVWSAEDGEEAFHRLTEESVDVLFLDVEFPPEGAFSLLERSRAAGLRLPKIVFVTGHDDYALEAFEWAACDYLLKPVTLERVKETLARVRASLTSPDLEALLQAVRGLAQDRPPERFTVCIRDRILVLKWSEVMYLNTEFRQIYAQTTRSKIPIDQAMDDLEIMLKDRFLRIHRSSLINLDYLVEVQNPPGRAGQAVMQDGVKLNVSRARMEDLLKRMGRLA